MGELPSGTVTFLFTDVEASTRLLREIGEVAYAHVLADHRLVLREAFSAHGGIEVDTQGDAFFVAFATAPSALAAASDALGRLDPGPIRIRVGIHTGTPLLTEEGYVGHDVHRAARIAAAGHGGQVLVSSSTTALVGVHGLRDLGEHRLKDLSAPERIYQLGDRDFPPLKSLHQTNLPVPTTPFLGREKELGEVLGLVSREEVRLVTLTGPGGTGKTRLGAQAAGALGEVYPHGVWWIPLAPLRDPALVVETAAQTLAAQDGLAEHISDKRMLLLFDNFEQVIEAAGELADLLTSCPNLDLLVTSREALHVTGEQEYAVPPFVHEEGVGFFVARARAVDPNFDTDDSVSEICQRLDDLPLALELAAVRVKALSSREILQRLDRRLPLLTGGARDLPQRQRTLRATIEWSHELLTPNEQRIFSRLAVFRGGCTLGAAEEIAEADIDTLQSLVDKSLVRHARERYSMLETIREYAEERLTDSGEGDEMRRRHGEHFLALAEEAEPNLLVDPKEWLEPLEREQDNFRAAFDSFETTGHTQLLLRLVGALWKFWYQRGYPAEGCRQLEAALKADERPTLARGKALNGATAVLLEAGDRATAKLRAEEALTLHREFEDPWSIANSIHMLGVVEAQTGNHEAARELLEEGLRRFRELGDDHYVLLEMRVLAWMNYELGDHTRARELHATVIREARRTGDVRMEAMSLGALAEYELYEGRVREATPMLERAYEISTDRGQFRETSVGLCRFARALALVDKPETATQLLGSAEALHEEAGVPVYPWVAKLNDGTLAMIRPHLDDLVFSKAWEQGRTLTPDEAVALALDALA